jgi:hypothetical protein
VREWLAAQAAAGYVDYDSSSAKFSMSPEQAMVFADEESPVFMGAVGDLVAATILDEPKISQAFRTGKGVGWNERSTCLFYGTARFFRTSYKHHRVRRACVRSRFRPDSTASAGQPRRLSLSFSKLGPD